MSNRTKTIIYIGLIIILALIFVREVKAEDPPRNITNCVYGDSVTPEVCDKLTEDNKPKETKPVEKVEPLVFESFEGK